MFNTMLEVLCTNTICLMCFTIRTKGGQGKGQKGKKQKKKEQDETPAIRDHDSKVAPDLGALCI
jgi:hypothetical protein